VDLIAEQAVSAKALTLKSVINSRSIN
jgi:hypothetical protein